MGGCLIIYDEVVALGMTGRAVGFTLQNGWSACACS